MQNNISSLDATQMQTTLTDQKQNNIDRLDATQVQNHIDRLDATYMQYNIDRLDAKQHYRPTLRNICWKGQIHCIKVLNFFTFVYTVISLILLYQRENKARVG